MNGRDIVGRVVYGPGISLLIAFLLVLIGAVLSVVAGYRGRGVDTLAQPDDGHVPGVPDSVVSLSLWLVFNLVGDGLRDAPDPRSR